MSEEITVRRVFGRENDGLPFVVVQLTTKNLTKTQKHQIGEGLDTFSDLAKRTVFNVEDEN